MSLSEERRQRHQAKLVAAAETQKKVKTMKDNGRTIVAIAQHLNLSENTVRHILDEEKINWRQNCLTSGPHDGRPEKLWNLPLLQAVTMFDHHGLQEIVVARIYNDAMQFVEYSSEENRFTREWAEQLKARAEEKFLPILALKMTDIQKYYSSSSWQTDVDGVIERIKLDKLNPHYEPLHGHDTVNMLCRILGVTCLH